MAKRINQESFDDVVKENMGEFGMEAQEAIDDAVQQFESQGVNLANIVKDASLFGENGEKVEHPVITAINQLKISVENSDKGEIIQILKKLKSECDVDLAKRCMAGNNDAYTVLLNAAIKHKNDNEILKEILSGLISLTNGQPDVLDEAGCSFLVENLTTKADDKDLLVTNLKLIRNTCIKHESNRQLYVKKKMITELVNILIEKKKEPAVVIEACGLLRCLTYDDDVRVPFGSAHEHAKMIVTEGNCLKMLLELSQEYSDNTSVLKELFSTMSVVVVRDEFCKAVMDMGGLDFILKALQNNLGEKILKMWSSILSFVSLLIVVHATSDYVKPWFCHKLDCPKFTVLQNTTDYQLRHYIPSKWVATNMTVTTYSHGHLFQKLFQYISGNNVPGEKVEMTAPVVTTVIPNSDGTTMYIMHFMIPYAVQANTPLPNDSDVYLVDVPAMNVYVKSFGGFARDNTYVTKLQELKTSLDTSATNLYDSSQFFTLGYDSPFAFINRHNEVWLQAVKA